ncbi:NAD-dependent epimerase/dehydratase family protein [Pelagibacterium halotolerans]|uniref:NAD-dependent epimerase/dehydratase family protein n=1 Tax=Pelagibacterium halotolerans TaxID=531813 RepID=UPI00384ABC29
MKLLVTGAAGKVGQNFLARLRSQEAYADWEVVALCHNRKVEETGHVRTISGSLADAALVQRAMEGVTHVLHMAAVKESPDLAIDVAVKGMFLLLEEARRSPTLRQFVLISGDCTVGRIFHRYPEPITEVSPRMAYPGCYALTKVLEEVMIEQYQVQYGLRGTVLRAPWIMEKDDFKFALTFGSDQFGGPPWSALISAEEEADFAARGVVPLMLGATGVPLKRSFIHVDDLVSAIFAALGNPAAEQNLFNIAMNEPVDYAVVADYLARTRNIEAVEIQTPFHSNWLGNSKARLVLGWRPENDFEALIERAWTYMRDPGDPRKIWYPG